MVSLPCCLSAIPLLQVAEEDVDANLVGDAQIEVGRLGGEVAHQFRLGGGVGGDQRNGPGPLVHAASPFFGNGFAGGDLLARAGPALPSSGPSCGLVGMCSSTSSVQKIVEMNSPKW